MGPSVCWGGGGGGGGGEGRGGQQASSLSSNKLWNFHRYSLVINITLSQQRQPTTVHSNDTLVDTSFQLISGYFHVNQGV